MTDRTLYEQLAQRFNYPLTERFERVLRKLLTAEECRLVLACPAPVEELAAQFALTPAEIEAKLQNLVERGPLMPHRGGPSLPRSMLQFHDTTLTCNPKFVDDELCALWSDFSFNEWYPVWAQTLAEAPRARDRVIPHFQAIQHLPSIRPSENVYEIVRAARRWTVVPCTCRLAGKKCDAPVNVCLQLDRGADYAIGRDAGPELTVEEAIAIIDRAAEAGLIHQVGNKEGNVNVVCNCCTDDCVIFAPLLSHFPDQLERGIAKSRYEASIAEEACNGCQTCLDRCRLDAIELRRFADSKRMKAFVNPEKCWGCGACASGCPEGAATLHLVRPPEYIPAE